MKTLNFAQMEKIDGGKMSANQECLALGGIFVACVGLGFLVPVFWGGAVASSIAGVLNC